MNKLKFLFAEFVMVMCMMLMCGCSTITEMRQMTGDGTSVEAEYYDQKTQRYVTQRQYDTYNFIDFWVKRVGLAIALICMVAGFIIRRVDHVNAIFRMRALALEVGVPLLYIFGAYSICFWADRFVG